MKNYRYDIEISRLFSVAEMKGNEKVKSVYKDFFKHNEKDYKKLTDLAYVLLMRYEKWKVNNNRLSNLYNRLWENLNDYMITHLKGKDLDYYFSIIE